LPTKENQFLELLQQHKGILHKVCRIYVSDEKDQRDLLQEIILQLWSAYDSFRGDSQFSTWMYRVALNTAIVFYKKEARRQRLFLPLSNEALSKSISVVDDQKEQLVLFYKALQELNKIEKAVIFLYMQGLPGAEIAECLGISPQNARVRINRTKQKLQQILKYMGYELG